MKLIRDLEQITLLKSEKIKQANGTYIDNYIEQNKYNVSKHILNDEVNATIYGSKVVNMLSIGTALGDLEELLKSKIDNKKDNICLYFIKINNSIYKINSVSDSSILIERI